ncbi:MAG: hypothetical protein QOG48_175, partial [Verrucomicrobiota bacterium]
MPRPAQFWRQFATKEAAEDAIRAVIDPQPFDTPFESTLLSELVAERHYFCSRRGLRPFRFRKLRHYKAYLLEGDFSVAAAPRQIGWHGVSWTKCLAPPQTDWQRIVRAMRDRCKPAKTSYRQSHPICETCLQRPSVEAHHENPTFHALTEQIRSQMSDAEVTDCLAGWDWFCA